MSDPAGRLRRALRDPRRELPAWPDPMRRAARRRRARFVLLTTVAAGAAAAVIVAVAATLPTSSSGPQPIVSAPTCPARTAEPAPHARSGDHGRVVKQLVGPGALAVGPHGQLYIADDSLSQILQALPGGRFKVIAGNGRRGYSG